MARVGYARVSSVGQSLAGQLEKLQHCDKVFQETHSGASSTRLRFDACLDYVREGDTLVVTRLDRLARSTLRSARSRLSSSARGPSAGWITHRHGRCHRPTVVQHAGGDCAVQKRKLRAGTADGRDSESERAGCTLRPEEEIDGRAEPCTAAPTRTGHTH